MKKVATLALVTLLALPVLTNVVADTLTNGTELIDKKDYQNPMDR